MMVLPRDHTVVTTFLALSVVSGIVAPPPDPYAQPTVPPQPQPQPYPPAPRPYPPAPQANPSAPQPYPPAPQPYPPAPQPYPPAAQPYPPAPQAYSGPTYSPKWFNFNQARPDLGYGLGMDNTGTSGYGTKVLVYPLVVLPMELICCVQGWNVGSGAPIVDPFGRAGGGWDQFLGIVNKNKKAEGINPKQVSTLLPSSVTSAPPQKSINCRVTELRNPEVKGWEECSAIKSLVYNFFTKTTEPATGVCRSRLSLLVPLMPAPIFHLACTCTWPAPRLHLACTSMHLHCSSPAPASAAAPPSPRWKGGWAPTNASVGRPGECLCPAYDEESCVKDQDGAPRACHFYK